MADKKRTEVSELGEYGLVEELTKGFKTNDKSTIKGVGDDAAVIDSGRDGYYTLLTSDMLLEGVAFDLTYFPVKHLGYKAVTVGVNDIFAMNGTPRQITVSLGVSSKLCVEDLQALYEGIQAACEDYGVDLAGGDTTASVNGLAINISVLGDVEKERVVYRDGAGVNDLICITGDLGSAYMGLHLLEREKRVLKGHPDPQPKFEGYEYLLRRQLMPSARKDVIEALRKSDIIPTSMIDLSDGLASDLLQVCRASGRGARIYLDRIPISKEAYAMAGELNTDPVVAALNGGDDHELLFTVPLECRESIMAIGGIEIIGHITAENTGAYLVTPDGGEIQLTAPGIK